MGFQKFLQHGDVNDLAVVLAFDPGGTTGWCAMAVEPRYLDRLDGEYGATESLGVVGDGLAHIEYGQIDCDPPGIGLAQMHNGHTDLNESRGFSRIHVQNRSLAKTTCSDIRLKHWGLYDHSSGAHARDATRHAYYFLRDRRGSSVEAAEKRWRAWPHLFADPAISETKNAYKEAPKKKQMGERI